MILCNIKLGPISESPMFFPGFDKLVHCGFFFMVVVLSANGYLWQKGTDTLKFMPAFVITAISIIYGGVIELLQLYVFTWRDGNWPDLFADAVGACMAIFCILVIIGSVKHVKK
ncbi:VanZ family protein [Mucilaginibacter corticis]|uniref:VanZ family protein n=1 Tax=Mucilaginibacter corticis TaxID=2597670 RepID=A0A556MUV7_9SPHI|nr:VanZ family protein [Mucilaginibacter corticis]TSJ43724.1 VanZ family protein [Mucilaginibacter corticis]